MNMKGKHWKYLGFFVLGTFLGGWVLGALGTILGRFTGRK